MTIQLFQLSRKIMRILPILGVALCLTNCANRQVMVSVADQRMVVLDGDQVEKVYPISTSKYGLGDRPGSKCTPLGTMKVAKKIGRNAPAGAVFKSRRRTGEILPPNAPGRDPIVTRILWLRGTESQNRNAYRRYIYIHGTPEEWRIGRRASYGCIRMRSKDIIDLYRRIGVGTEVTVVPGSLKSGKYLARNQQRSFVRKERFVAQRIRQPSRQGLFGNWN